MATKRTPLRRDMHWQVTPAAVQLWRLVLELQAQPRDRDGDLSEENRVALRDAITELARVVGFSKFDVGIALAGGLDEEPPGYILDNAHQLEVWQEAKQVQAALNQALLQQAAQAVQRRKPPRTPISADGA